MERSVTLLWRTLLLQHEAIKMSCYCTPADVASLLRLIDPNTQQRLVFSDATDPTAAEVESAIASAAESLNHRTGTAWQIEKVEKEYHHALPSFVPQPHISVCLNFPPLNILSSEEGDKLEIWNGHEWTDLLSDSKEGRDADYWVDYQSGIINLRRKPAVADNSVRVTYRSGHSEVPADIKDACAKLVAIWYIESDFFRVGLPYGENLPDPMSKVERWKEEVDRVVADHRIMTVCNHF